VNIRWTLLLLLCIPGLGLAVEQYTYKVLERKPQTRDHWVQGLEIVDGQLYVSTGRHGQSRLIRYQFDSGEVDILRHLPRQIFAEGLTVLGDTVYQLTWRNRALLVWDRETLESRSWLPLSGEGWGLTHNGTQLIYSDGSDKLHFMSPDTGHISHSVTVTEAGKALHRLNELEYIEGKVWANVWQTDRIVTIDPISGKVLASIDLSGLLPQEERRGTDVLNGIAHNPADGAIWVTGKLWPWIYRIELLRITPTPAPEDSVE
jgi:glutamine cyclotransferase